jgi:hypothetical protein
MAIKKNTSPAAKITPKATPAPGKAPAAAAAPARAVSAAPVSSTPVRNTPIPKTIAAAAPVPARKEISHEMIAKRAFEISQSGFAGSQDENWLRAETELRGV